MGITFFDLKPKKKTISKTEETTYTKVLLTKHEELGRPSSLTYLDKDGNIKEAKSDFMKNEDGSYIMIVTSVERHPIFDKENIEYESVDEHFSYKDKDGKSHIFNDIESLKYDESTNTYTGSIKETQYITSTVEVFTKEEN